MHTTVFLPSEKVKPVTARQLGKMVNHFIQQTSAYTAAHLQGIRHFPVSKLPLEHAFLISSSLRPQPRNAYLTVSDNLGTFYKRNLTSTVSWMPHVMSAMTSGLAHVVCVRLSFILKAEQHPTAWLLWLSSPPTAHP